MQKRSSEAPSLKLIATIVINQLSIMIIIFIVITNEKLQQNFAQVGFDLILIFTNFFQLHLWGSG